ncbi:uncharacterized protein LOC9645676 isoform X2 [Selaginella moellendorffii]|uniref:uncharacterized protein LOC9645676 isoform X2 n=1 Tax=Selaginella moellendorffii TaxID=88036 RepID=UPI000D1CC7B6|nr:uncharacterized protein LOC9645676 isoform X2 [Selaginella moellendorffii]|eukprot:XP_024530402.1 uncharacterized protein LOC9645676 isoform X2 [Selaginella moellendorffii]
MLLCLSAISPVRFSFQRQQTPSTSPPAIVPEIFNHEACLIDAVPASNRPWFPYKDEFHLDKPEKQSSSSKVVIASLAEFVEKQMKERFERVVRSRSYSACFVAEALDNAGNIAAIFRSAEAFGFQSVHVITSLTVKGYKGVRRAHRGTERWLDVEVWNCAKDCIQALRSRGYRIAVTSTGHDTVSICEMDWTIPTAVIFGNEHDFLHAGVPVTTPRPRRTYFAGFQCLVWWILSTCRSRLEFSCVMPFVTGSLGMAFMEI